MTADNRFSSKLSAWVVAAVLILANSMIVQGQSTAWSGTGPSAGDVMGAAAGATAEPTASKAIPEMTASDLAAFLDGALPPQLAGKDIAGAVVAVVRNGKLLFAKGYGFADFAKKTPVSAEQTLFRPGSISKLFTWTAVMQLAEQGKLDLDQDVNAYIDFEIPKKFIVPITLRNLLTHTPGFEEVLKELFINDTANLKPLGMYVKEHVPQRIFPPGVTPAHSNYGAALAGYIVERVSGEPFADYVDRHILEPPWV